MIRLESDSRAPLLNATGRYHAYANPMSNPMSKLNRAWRLLTLLPMDWRVAVRDVLVEAGNRLLWNASTDWERNGEMFAASKVLMRTSAPVVLDVGANTGAWAVSLLQRFPRAEVHCFEPIPDFFDEIPEFPGLNKYPYGLGSTDGTAVYYQVGRGGSEVAAKAANSDTAIQHELPRRDAASAIMELGLERIDLVKVDVDGTELAVLAGLRPVLEYFLPPVQFEFGHFNYANGDSFHAFTQFFAGIGYELTMIRPKKLLPLHRYRAITHENPCNLNYLASRPDGIQ